MRAGFRSDWGSVQPTVASCCSRSRFLRPFPILRQEGGCSWLSALPFSLVSEEGGPSRPPREGGRLTRAHSVAELGCDFRAHHYPAWGSFTSANWQFLHTKSSLIRASVDSWSANGWPQLSLHLIFPHLQRRKPTSWFLSSRTPDQLIHSQQPCNHLECSPLVIYPLCLLPSPIVFSLSWPLGLYSRLQLFSLGQLVSTL